MDRRREHASLPAGDSIESITDRAARYQAPPQPRARKASKKRATRKES